MNISDTRPVWDFKLSEADVKRLNTTITEIRHQWHMTGVDTSEDWIEFRSGGKWFKAPDGWDMYFDFNPNWRELIQPNYRGEEAIKRLEEIAKFEQKHRRELATYERLRRKFEVSSART